MKIIFGLKWLLLLLVIQYHTDVQNISSDDITDAHDGDLFMSLKDSSDELGESMGMSTKLAIFTILISLPYYAFLECDDILREIMIHEGSTSNYYPFPSKEFALLYSLVHSPRRIVSIGWVLE